MTRDFTVKLIISLVAIFIIVIHVSGPKIRIDAATISLLIVALLPWLSSLIQTVEFPGGLKVTLRDIEEAGNKVRKPQSQPTLERRIAAASYPEFPDQDPNLAMVRLGLEIEKRLRALAQKHQIKNSRSLKRLLQGLKEAGVLSDDAVIGLQDLTTARNLAAHGAKVEKSIAAWAFEYGPSILATLDAEAGK